METTERIYRDADASQIMAQLGTMTRMSIGFRNVLNLGDGISGQVGMGNPHYKLSIRLLANDTYHVEIIRRRGGKASLDFITEFSADDVYCDQLSKIVLDAWSDIHTRKGR